MIKVAKLHAHLSALKHHFTRGATSTLGKGGVAAMKRQSHKSGPDSFALFLGSKALGSAAGKRGKVKIRNAVWRATQKAPLDVDTALGNVAVDAMPGRLKGLFKVKEQLPVAKDMIKEVDRPSITAPLVKAKNVATPIIVGHTIERALHKMRNGKSERHEADA